MSDIDNVFQIYDRKGKPVSFMDHLRLFSDENYKRVAWTEVDLPTGKVQVSTVWLGLVHPLGIHHVECDCHRERNTLFCEICGKAVGAIFETMVFGNTVPGIHNYQSRYARLADAIRGHASIVKALEEGNEMPFPDTNIMKMLFDMFGRDDEGEEWKQAGNND